MSHIQQVKHVADLTDRNEHTEARIYLAETVLRDADLAACYRDIDRIQSDLGYVTDHLAAARNSLDISRLKPALQAKGLLIYWTLGL